MKDGFLERFSNVLAWFGFAIFFGQVLLVIVQISIYGRYSTGFGLKEHHMLYGLITYFVCGSIKRLLKNRVLNLSE